jgi:hypothetical protein
MREQTLEEYVASIDTDAIQFVAEKRMLAEKKIHHEREHRIFLRMFNIIDKVENDIT